MLCELLPKSVADAMHTRRGDRKDMNMSGTQHRRTIEHCQEEEETRRTLQDYNQYLAYLSYYSASHRHLLDIHSLHTFTKRRYDRN